ncbi:MAG TPA: ribonuclease H-like domain-containing protein [Candidatus Hydrogenedens sp.]|nr:ribonuclease H-like domain-containing protein [Candidatus Hydrogenedens sp.]
MEDNTHLNKLVEKLGLKKASELSHAEESTKNGQNQTENATRPSSPQTAMETASLLQKLRERLGTQVESTSSIHPELENMHNEPRQNLIGGTVIGNEDSQCLYFSETYPDPFSYGDVILSDALHFSVHEARLISAGNETSEFDLDKALFIDTETTSCFGGTGTVAFLVGIGFFVGNDFHLEQFFMRDYDDEPALLEALDERIKTASMLIGYNSKCFDFPLLRNRYLMNRLPFNGETLFHFDLMHVARRFWKRRLSDCSLSTVERYILHIRRYGDIPGSVIPQLWLNYIQTGKTQPIPRILEHNRRDILSLAGLMAWLAQRVQVPRGQGFEELLDRCALIRLQMKCEQYAEAADIAEDLLQQTEYFPIRTECWKMLSDAYKKLGKMEERVQSLIHWAEEEKESVIPRIELAKFYEHQQRQLEQALYWTEQAIKIEPHNSNHLKRKERLHRKIKWTADFDYPNE